MLAIRLQRVGRKGHALYRIIVQEAQRSPRSGRVIANVGSFNPHTKEVKVDKEATESYLQNGAQPSPRVARLLKAEKIKLPKWVEVSKEKKKRTAKNPDKLRKNQPAEEPAEEPTAEEATEETVADKTEDAAPAKEAEEAPAETEETK